MIRDIVDETRYVGRMTGRSELSRPVLAAMERVPREQFVGPAMLQHAFDNSPLPIGSGQTISQPFIVALMTDVAAPEPHDKVLEVGTGSGYQTAILAELVNQLYTVEILPEMARAARQRLDTIGYNNIHYRVGDGRNGWPEEAPFDIILVTAAAVEVPPTLIEQLRPGGRMVLPVGERYAAQELVLLEKDDQGAVSQSSLLPVAFVPLTSGH
ncbi:protein-L-isoaspartate(D-aspartate) O-methyltransferase [endosymbiont of Ridgeia piscesae]|jgi:protein-L-isoaspartate(D-aspartate) O-methyltransferase|uniref:Protein-L-isoaspartate O-methyltransferase n=2 Tax=endosymbiont of Ridgeia piscesae TaxID=54398 RepID=A0A0T5YZ97_9GAMM|nr:protein-L-isoaspartate(D-aspartate) O-methyltransferase [endosymbiont of Ridgeia piscesae]KRT57087.1 protein-L-isoaspartate(D-aspartate) O-methyltransferase [endosymbiont of Ridgeia piscesae]